MKKILMSSVLAMGLMFNGVVNATANVAIDSRSAEDGINRAFILQHSRPSGFAIYEEEAKEIGYYFETGKQVKLKQYVGIQGLFKMPFTQNTKLNFTDIVPYGVVVDSTQWGLFLNAINSVEVDNCLDCALYEKKKDAYHLKEHLLSMRAFVNEISTIRVKPNYALKQSAYDRLMKTNADFAEARNKASVRGFKLCPIVPDNQKELNLNMYIAKINNHITEVENKMKCALNN